MLKTKHIYDLNKINGGDYYYISIKHKQDGHIMCRQLSDMGYKGAGSWISYSDLPFYNQAELSILVSPMTKTFSKENYGLKKFTNVYKIDCFIRDVRENIFKFVMFEKNTNGR